MGKFSYKFIKNEILHSGHLQSLSASGVVYLSYVFVFGQRPGLILLIIIYLAFEFIFLHDRYYHIEEDRATNPVRTKHLKSYLKSIPIVLMFMLVSTYSLLFLFGNLLAIVSITVVIVLGYIYPGYVKRITKHFHLFKNLYVSVVYGFLVFLPLIFNQSLSYDAKLLWSFFAFVFIESLLMQMVVDLKDMTVDGTERLLTLPVVIGRDKTLKTVMVLSVFAALLFVYTFSIYGVWGLALLPALAFAVNAISLNQINKFRKNGYYIIVSKFVMLMIIAFMFSIIK